MPCRLSKINCVSPFFYFPVYAHWNNRLNRVGWTACSFSLDFALKARERISFSIPKFCIYIIRWYCTVRIQIYVNGVCTVNIVYGICSPGGKILSWAIERCVCVCENVDKQQKVIHSTNLCIPGFWWIWLLLILLRVWILYVYCALCVEYLK